MSTTPKVDRELRRIRVENLARLEGEGGLSLTLRNGRVEEARLEIFEPPRLFEAFLRSRSFQEVPDIAARICGICPVAHQMSACQALEKALGVAAQIGPGIRALRDLLYCGQWIESHALHMFLLHLPDFLGYDSALSMAADHKAVVEQALKLKKAGNQIIEVVAGRSIHPVGVCVGGFYSVPEKNRLSEILPALKAALETTCQLTMFLAEEVEYPEFERDYEFVALQPPGEYPINRGPIASSKGCCVDPEEFLEMVAETQLPHTTALRAGIRGRGAYHVGPLARLNLNYQKLHPRAAELLPGVVRAIGHDLPWQNSFLSLPARALETVHALALAVDLIERYDPPACSRVPVEACAGTGAAATEAPRGLLWHHYETDAQGMIRSARVIPPTSQNQAQIEDDLRCLAGQMSDLDDATLTLRCEQLVRNYDPCISCSVHCLKLVRRHMA